MAETKYQVTIWEYERGWGSSRDEIKHFDTEAEAKKFCDDYNAQNNLDEVPDWYMTAQYDGPVKV
jgi:hypothetical protein